MFHFPPALTFQSHSSLQKIKQAGDSYLSFSSSENRGGRKKNWALTCHAKTKSVSEWVLCAYSCLTLCDSMDCSPPGSSVHGIIQARILEWVAISFCRESSQPRDQTYISYVSCTGRCIIRFGLFVCLFVYYWATWEAKTKTGRWSRWWNHKVWVRKVPP